MVEHFYVKFSDPSCIGFLTHHVESRHRQTEVQSTTPPLPSA